jgi:hypothetical protein
MEFLMRKRSRACGRVGLHKAFILFQLALSTTLVLHGHAQTRSAGEDEIRAAMVSHLPLFVEWPPEKVDSAHPSFRVCVLGADPITPALEAAFNAASLKAPVTVAIVGLTDRLDQCQLLYVGASTRGSLERNLPALQQASVLIVSERSIDALAGEVIGLPLEESHVRVQVNLKAAQASKLTISSRLLRLAAVVKQP